MRPGKKNKSVSGNGSENFSQVRHAYFLNCMYYFYLEKIIILWILKGILPFKMNKIIFLFQKT